MIYLYSDEFLYLTSKTEEETTMLGIECPNSTTTPPPFEEYPQTAFDYKWDSDSLTWTPQAKPRHKVEEIAMLKRANSAKARRARSRALSFPSWYPAVGEEICVYGAFGNAQTYHAPFANNPEPNAPDGCLGLFKTKRRADLDYSISYVDGSSYANSQWDYGAYNEERVVPQVVNGKCVLNIRAINQENIALNISAPYGGGVRNLSPVSLLQTYDEQLGSDGTIVFYSNWYNPTPPWVDDGLINLNGYYLGIIHLTAFPYSPITYGGSLPSYSVWYIEVEKWLYNIRSAMDSILKAPLS